MLQTQLRQPDILEVIADLSSDEVRTPPRLVNAMLDLLPEYLWTDPNLRWLDPACKTGVFPREITKRLMAGLEAELPDQRDRLDHILKNMVFGVAITELTGLISRRTLYCSKRADGPKAVVTMPTPAGNLWFRRCEHAYRKGKCSECPAKKTQFESGVENHAYAFIHEAGRDMLKEEFDMKFDVIVGNPPYQLDDGGHGASASPIYHHFVETAIDMDPRYIVMITPSRWFSGGKGLDRFRTRMMADRRLRALVDFPKLYDGIPDVKIRGGLSYFLWDREHDGPCSVQTMWDGQELGPPVGRYLNAFDIIIRRNEAVPILQKIRSFRRDGKSERTLDKVISSRKPFGLPSNFRGKPTRCGLNDPVKLYANQHTAWIDRSKIPRNIEWVDDWKVLTTRAQGTSAAVETMFLSKPIIAGPGEACTETYLVAAQVPSRKDAELFAAYLRTRFVRFLISLRKVTQDAARGVYIFVPDISLDHMWTDEALYERYGITAEERAFIEETVKEMPA